MIDNLRHASIGEIVDKKNRNDALIKYKINYKVNGKINTFWSDWNKDCGYEIGDSVPIKIIHFPSKKGIIRIPTTVDGNPQQNKYCFARLIAACIISATVGFVIGNNRKK